MTSHETLTKELPVLQEDHLDARAQLVGALVLNGLMKQEYADSGALDAFRIDDKTGVDALEHILIGDEVGGGHHLKTIMDLEVPGRTIASEIPDYRDPNHVPLAKLRRGQAVRENGTFKSNIVKIQTDKGEVSKEKVGGSAMFPNEWNTQEVVEAVKKVADTPPESHDRERGSFVHIGEEKGVRIRVITDEKTGKIITATPKYSTK